MIHQYRNTRIVDRGCNHDVPALRRHFPNQILAHRAIDIAKTPRPAKVVCDDCGHDYTDSTVVGGIAFRERFIGPCCAERWQHMATRYADGTPAFVTQRCPARLPFATWVRFMRSKESASD